MLDTDTRVRVAFGSRPRTLYLYRGRVSLVVATDTARPFQIEAADKVVSAQGGMVDVRRDGDSVSVAVVNGGAEVLFVNDESERMQRLEAGQRLVAPSSAPARVDAPDLRQVTAWQNGQAIFDGDSLAEAATEMNRYSSRQIRIPDSEVRRLTISGVYQVGDTAAFADSVAAALPVRVRREPGGIALIAAPPTPQG
jgi:transmembrane sensor